MEKEESIKTLDKCNNDIPEKPKNERNYLKELLDDLRMEQQEGA